MPDATQNWAPPSTLAEAQLRRVEQAEAVERIQSQLGCKDKRRPDGIQS